MAQSKRGCGCAVAALLIFLVIAGVIFVKFFLPWYRARLEKRLPPPSGAELQVHVLDVGQGDSILIISPEGKTALIDAGDTGRGKTVLDALKRYKVARVDYFIATHAHADHIGAADEVIKAIPVGTVVDSGIAPPQPQVADTGANKNSARSNRANTPTLPTTKAYLDFLEAVRKSGAQYEGAEPGKRYDIGGGAFISVVAPIMPLFTRDQVRSGGNEPNANSIVTRLDYGEFSMLLTGDAEAQTEERMISKDADLSAKVLKVGHHGSKYATSDNFIKRVKPAIAIISDGEANRYGHPSQEILDRLRAANIQVYRTDLQGEITITTKGKDYQIKTAKEAKTDLWAGRVAQKDDSASRGFIAYGDFGPPPREKKEKQATK